MRAPRPYLVRETIPPSCEPRNLGTPESRFARQLFQWRRARASVLDARFLGEPAWDMILDLLIAADEGRPISISSLCIAADVPPTTALRTLNRLTRMGVIRREADPADRRRHYAVLSADCENRLRRLLRSWLQAGG